ncbi:Formin-like protein [Dirofilaria immitis]
MSTEDSFISNAPLPNPLCGDVVITEVSDTLPVNIATSNEGQERNLGQDSESFLVTDTDPTERQNGEAEHYDIQPNSKMSSAIDDIPKIDVIARGRNLKKDRPTSYRGRERSLSENPRIIALNKKRATRRRHPTPYPTKLSDPIDFDE